MVNEKRKNDIIYLINYLYKLIQADLDKRLEEYGLTGTQGRMLFFISRRSMQANIEVHQNDIENEFHLSKSTVSGVVKRMEKNGFLNIKKRCTYAILTPTDKAKDVLKHLAKHKDDAVDLLLKDVQVDKRKELIETLNKLINNMEGGSHNVEEN